MGKKGFGYRRICGRSKVIRRGDTHRIGRKNGSDGASGVGNVGRSWEESVGKEPGRDKFPPSLP